MERRGSRSAGKLCDKPMVVKWHDRRGRFQRVPRPSLIPRARRRPWPLMSMRSCCPVRCGRLDHPRSVSPADRPRPPRRALGLAREDPEHRRPGTARQPLQLQEAELGLAAVPRADFVPSDEHAPATGALDSERQAGVEQRMKVRCRDAHRGARRLRVAHRTSRNILPGFPSSCCRVHGKSCRAVSGSRAFPEAIALIRKERWCCRSGLN